MHGWHYFQIINIKGMNYPQAEQGLSLWEFEVARYKKKGLTNCLIAAVLYFPSYYFWYSVEKYIWTTYQLQIQSVSPKLIVTIGASLLHTITALLCLLILLPTYMGRSTWLQKYRVPVILQLTIGQ